VALDFRRSVVSMSGDPVTLLDWRCRMDGAFAAARAASAPAEGQCPLATPGNAVPARVATGLGARVFMPAMDVPTVGRMAGIASSQGVTFYVIKYAQ